MLQWKGSLEHFKSSPSINKVREHPVAWSRPVPMPIEGKQWLGRQPPSPVDIRDAPEVLAEAGEVLGALAV